jgi:hypothetical protein
LEPKKENPQKHGTLTFASIIAILTGITSLLIFLTGKTSLPDIILGETATPTFTPTVTLAAAATDTPIPLPLPTATLAQGSGNTPASTESILLVQAPSNSDLEAVPSLWTLTHFKELPAPGSNGYTVEVTHDSVWLWDCYFCATNDTFQEFLSTLKVEFRINNVSLPENSFRVYDRKGTAGWLCRDWAAMISGWPPDKSVFLEIRYTHSEKAFDGKADFAAGEYSQLIVVVVKG